MAIQVMGEKDCCSSIGDIEQHEKFKKLPKEERIAKLQQIYDAYGVRSDKFFIQVKPFIMWTVYRYLRGMSYTFLEDLVNNAYEELIIAFEGGWTTHYNAKIYKQKIYGTPEYFNRFKNIGEFVMYVTGSSVAKYRAKNFRKQVLHEDNDQDISEKLNFTDFEIRNNLDYELEDPNDEPLFRHFKFNEAMKKHLHMVQETRPRNNILYNFMLWKKHQ